MTETIPSSSPYRTKARFFIPAILALFLFSSAFAPSSKRPVSSEEDAEIMQLRSFITGYAQNFLGLKYRYAGISPNTGFDCSGFTSYILKEFGIKVSSGSATQSKQGVKIPLDAVQAGDLVFFGRGRHIQHVAMVVERTDEGIVCVHSTSSRGIVVENVSTSRYWKPRILFARDVISPQVDNI